MHGVGGGLVTVVAVRHAADERVFVRLFGEEWKEFADLHAGDVGRERGVKRAGVVGTGGGLGVEGVDVTGAAPEPYLDDGLRLRDGFWWGRGGENSRRQAAGEEGTGGAEEAEA